MSNTKGMILGAATVALGVIVTVASAGAATPAAAFFTKMGIGLMVSGALSTIGAALAPRPSDGSGDMGGTTYGSRASSVAVEGEPKKITLGEMQIYPEIVSLRTESDGKTETIRALLHVGSGGPFGIESISGIKLNDNSLDHFTGVEYETRLGTAEQTVMKGFDETSIAYPVNEQLPNTAWSYETKGAVDSAAVVLAWYGGLYKIGDGIRQTHWAAEVEYKDYGSAQWVKVTPPADSDVWDDQRAFITYGQSTSVQRRVIRLDFDTKKKRTIRINTYKSWSDETYKRQATVVRVEEITDDNNAYPGEALLGLKYVANEQLSGGLPKISCVVKGWKVKNLGDSEAAWTQNPAKLLLALLTDAEMGAGRYFPESMFDTGVGGSWRTAASYFDEQVIIKESKGRNRLEDRTHLDLVIDSMQNADEWVQHILDLTRSHLIDWGEDGIRLVVDKASSSVATFDGRQSRSSSNRPILRNPDGRIDLVEHEIETDKRTTHLTGVYWNEDDDYARRFTDELVDPDYVTGAPRVTSEIFMPGVTRQSQALRQCRYRLNIDRLRTLVYEFGVGIGDLDLLPMDVVTVYADSPPLDGVQMQVLGTTYDADPTRGRIAAVLYDGDVYADTTDTLQAKAPSLSRAKALKSASTVPAGVTNLKLTEVVGSSHLRVEWDIKADANRRLLRIYLSSSKGMKGEYVSEAGPNATSYLIRNIEEGQYYVRVLAVGRGGTEESWTVSAGTGSILITRQKNKPGAHQNVGAGNVYAGVGKAIVVDPPDADDPPQKVEVIKGADEHTGQVIGTYDVERTGTTGEQGQRLPSIPLPTSPGRGTGGGNETIIVRPITEGGKAPGPATTLSVPFLDLPNFSRQVIASIIGATRVGFDAPASTDPWELDSSDGVRLRAVPSKTNATEANGWGTKESGLLASNPAMAHYLVGATITSQERDLGAVKTFVLECYDEFRRKIAAADIPAHLARFPANPADDPAAEDHPLGIAWASRLLDKEMRHLRPINTPHWEYRVADAPSLSGDWQAYVPNLMLRGQYLQVRCTVSEPMGFHQLVSNRLLVNAWVANDTRLVTKTGGDFTTGELGDLSTQDVKEIGVVLDVGSEEIQVNIGGTIFKTALST